jgi:hypothetical protein
MAGLCMGMKERRVNLQSKELPDKQIKPVQPPSYLYEAQVAKQKVETLQRR